MEAAAAARRSRPRRVPAPARAAALAAVGSLLVATVSSAAFAGLPTGGPWRRSAGAGAPAGGRHATPRRALQTLERTRQASEWRLSVGHAIDALRTDIERFTDEAHTPDVSIFSEDVVVEDARLPDFRLRGLATYKRVVSTLKWSLRTTCDQARLEITSMRPPVNGELHMRWRLRMWPRDVLASAKDFLVPGVGRPLSSYSGEPLIVEGYSRYEFHPWTAEIVRHTIDVTNPPMLIVDLLRRHQTGNFAWAPPISAGVPGVMNFAAEASPAAHLALPSGGGPSAWSPTLPQACEDDYECNGGHANFPLQCCEVPVLGRFCCEPEEFLSSGRPEPAYVPIPVPSEDHWRQRHTG